MLNFGNKEFRNLQEQVLKNMNDISDIVNAERVLADFGIKVLGWFESEQALKEAYPEETTTGLEYGDAFAIHDVDRPPYEFYIWTRTEEVGKNGIWFNIGEFPKEGPQGEQGLPGEKGEKGDKGDRGEQGLRGPVGPTGPRGEKGETGENGLQGPKGDKGETGGLIEIIGILDSSSDLPDPVVLDKPDAAYLITNPQGGLDLWIQIGESMEDKQWVDVGAFNRGTAIKINDEIVPVYDATHVINTEQIVADDVNNIITIDTGRLDMSSQDDASTWKIRASNANTLQINSDSASVVSLGNSSIRIGSHLMPASGSFKNLGLTDANYRWGNLYLNNKINGAQNIEHDTGRITIESKTKDIVVKTNGVETHFNTFDGSGNVIYSFKPVTSEGTTVYEGTSLGTSVFPLKDIRLNGEINFNYTGKTATYQIRENQYENLEVARNGAGLYSFGSQNLFPNSNNQRSLGTSSLMWKNLYLSGNISDGTTTKSITEILAGGGGDATKVVFADGNELTSSIVVNGYCDFNIYANDANGEVIPEDTYDGLNYDETYDTASVIGIINPSFIEDEGYVQCDSLADSHISLNGNDNLNTGILTTLLQGVLSDRFTEARIYAAPQFKFSQLEDYGAAYCEETELTGSLILEVVTAKTPYLKKRSISLKLKDGYYFEEDAASLKSKLIAAGINTVEDIYSAELTIKLPKFNRYLLGAMV